MMDARTALASILLVLLSNALSGCAPSRHDGDNDAERPADDDNNSDGDDSDDDNDDDASPAGEVVEIYGTSAFQEHGGGQANNGCIIRHAVDNEWDETKFDYCTLWSIWGVVAGNVMAVGLSKRPSDQASHSFLVHLQNGKWVEERDPRPATAAYGVGGARGVGFYVAGVHDHLEHGLPYHDWVIGHFDGIGWQESARGGSWIGGWADLWAIWSALTGEVFAVGENEYGYLVVQNVNGRWRRIVGYPEAGILLGVWGSSSHDVFAVGGDATSLIVHYDGVKWSKMASGNDLPFGLSNVMGSSGTDVYAVGAEGQLDGSGVVLHYDGETWQDTYAPVQTKTDSLWVAGPSSVYVPDGPNGILHYDGSEWTLYSSAEVHYIWGFVHSPGERR